MRLSAAQTNLLATIVSQRLRPSLLPSSPTLRNTHFTTPKIKTTMENNHHSSIENKLLTDADRKKPDSKRGTGRAGRAGRGGGRSNGNNRGSQPREVQVSKALSKLLRHQASNAGITLDDQGFAPLPLVLSYGPIRSLKVSLEEIKDIVATNEKQRFALKKTTTDDDETADCYLIRANQGHSIKLDSSAGLLQPLTIEDGNIPDKAIHGTYYAFWDKIVSSGGLKPMGRNHVHCSAAAPEEGAGVISGMRRDAELMVEIDVGRCIAEGGMRWWRSDNGVLLTEGDGDGVVGLKYFRKVWGRKGDVGVLWEEGVKVGDLPEGLKKRIPQGKGGSRGGGGGQGRGGRRGGSRGDADGAEEQDQK